MGATSNFDVVDSAVYFANARTETASTMVGPLVIDPNAPVAAGSANLSLSEVNIGPVQYTEVLFDLGPPWGSLILARAVYQNTSF